MRQTEFVVTETFRTPGGEERRRAVQERTAGYLRGRLDRGGPEERGA